ncbi:hypothetical protein LRS10_09360 [Phenylobacterium sp. J426]|uniref:hypothetical protein n=1 Tax=Phenylobacterium sp. J426 TaxID=2898439 RepID=UPI00215161F3|nr:hypothetical protein [Phenylobacterium sp. J426]MCR5874350.1 hypothetical protein [Phenylobacterium sp. J426]
MLATAFLWIRSNRLIAGLAGVGVGLLLLTLAWMLAVHVGERREAARQAERRAAAITDAVTIDSAAKEVAAEQRLADARRMAELQRELEKADDQEDDNRPSAARLAYLCRVRAQQAGGASGLPPACRSAGAAGAASAR